MQYTCVCIYKCIYGVYVSILYVYVCSLYVHTYVHVKQCLQYECVDNIHEYMFTVFLNLKKSRKKNVTPWVSNRGPNT